MSQREIKQTIIHALEANDLDAVVAIVRQQKRAVSLLVRLAYDKDTLVGWRAIKAIGLAARALVGVDDEFLRVTIRKQLWSLTDESGGIGWSAPEIIGEIVSADPAGLSDIIPIIAEVYNIEEKVFRPGVMYALTRIADSAPEIIAGYKELINKALIDEDPLVKVYTTSLVGKIIDIAHDKGIWDADYIGNILNSIKEVENCSKVVWIYKNNAFNDIQVGESAKIAHNNIGSVLRA